MPVSRSTPRRPSGFTLIEMLVVIAIISILLTAAGPIFDSFANNYSPRTVASAVAGQLERARLHAIARNSYVWVRLGQVAEEPNDFFVGIYETLDGTDNATNAKGAWSGPRFRDFRLSNQLDPGFTRPAVPPASQPDAAAWVRFSPSGEAALIPANPKENRVKLVPPTAAGTVTPWIEMGIQPTRRGTVPVLLKQDVGSVQLSALTGQTLVFSR